jgi:hypothetical protein
LKRELPFEIGPGETINLACVVVAAEAGPLRSQLTLYAGNTALREYVVALGGKAVDLKPN